MSKGDEEDRFHVSPILRAAIDVTPDVYFVKDRDHRLRVVSRSLAVAMGKTTEEMEGHLDSEFWPKEICEGDPETGRRGYHDEDRDAFEGAEIRSIERVVLGDGVEHVFHTDRVPLRDASGEVFGVLGCARDVTASLLLAERTADLESTTSALRESNARLVDEIEARRAAQEELRAANEALERRVRERTRELRGKIADHQRAEAGRRELEERLRQSEKLESIGTLAGGIAHDFNNLLTIILGGAEYLLMESEEDPTLSEYLGEIRDAAERAGQLTAQILAFGRKQILKPRSIDLNSVINDALRLLRRTIGEQYQLDFRPSVDLGSNYADPIQLEQVLLNLCVNARDAMPDGGAITIETQNVVIDDEYMRTHTWGEPGRYVQLTVSDHGVGMAPDVIERIFDPFFTTKELGRGTGLGLATVYGIVRQHEGLIHVSSEPGRGSDFKIYLPIVDRVVDRVESPPEAVESHGNERILVAEDDASIRRILERVLVRAGYRVALAEDGAVALEMFESDPSAFDMVLVDAVMPHLNGRDTLAAMRSADPGLRFLIMSGYAHRSELDVEHVDAWVAKPFSPDQLLHRVRRALDGA